MQSRHNKNKNTKNKELVKNLAALLDCDAKEKEARRLAGLFFAAYQQQQAHLPEGGDKLVHHTADQAIVWLAESDEEGSASITGREAELIRCATASMLDDNWNAAREDADALLLHHTGIDQRELALEFLNRVGNAPSVAYRALADTQLARHGRTRGSIEALIECIASIGGTTAAALSDGMDTAIFEHEQRARAFIATTFAGTDLEHLMEVLANVAYVGGGLIESDLDLAAARESGSIRDAVDQMLFNGLSESTARSTLALLGLD